MRNKARLLAAAGVAAITAAPAYGQAVETADIITVTTQKREQSLSEVPINLTAYNSERLDLLGIQQFDELSDFVPGLEIQEQSPNNPGFVIRGITSDSGAATDEARVAVFQDGVSISRSRGSYVELFDMERVEIARGPQPTLFGRGALIGGINLIQNKADFSDNYGNAEIAFGDFNRAELRGMINMPVSDRLGFRFSGVHKERDGYVDNALGGEAFNSVDLNAIRGVVSWEPTADFRFDLIANYQEDTPAGTSFKSGTFAPLGGEIEPWEPAALNTFGGFEGGRDLGLEREVYSVTALADYQLNDAWSVSSITGWREFESLEIFDPDGFEAELLVVAEDARGSQWSQEVRFNYDNGGDLTAFFGGSYFYENGTQRIPLATNPRVAQAVNAPLIAALAGASVSDIEAGLALFSVPNASGFDNPYNPVEIFVLAILPGFIDPSLAQIVPLGDFYLEETANTSSTEAIDLFGELSYQVNDRLELTGGLRWTQEDKETEIYARPITQGSPIVTLTPGPTLFIPYTENGDVESSGKRTFDDFTWRFAANYQLSDSANIWASYARGRRPDVLSYSGGDFVVAPAELVDSLEFGLFKTWESTTFQGSVYYSEYENFQTGRFEPNSANFVTDNAGRATQFGFEAQLDHELSETFAVFATYAYNFAEFNTADNQGNAQEFAGNVFRLSPEHAFSIGLLKTKDLGAHGTLSFVPTFSWQSEVFFDNDNDLTDAIQDEVQGDFGLVNARLRYDTASNGLYGELFVTNALDEEYIIDAGNTGDSFGIPTFIAGAPRMYGARLGVNF
ncbi:TonB-dependent receptor [Maricaulis sp.]|uniref:TonB-dependent receptor n=1 Tax=Maricaulis sp. TaxID=1486257 RepID=UPI002611D0BA|nr:TonB-dependent receptor [Maricaulis sp.]